jgi:hypothetical protein
VKKARGGRERSSDALFDTRKWKRKRLIAYQNNFI